jgi:hypothetical protein
MDDTLASLTEQAKQAATAYETLERQTVEARREQALIYGRALRAIRAQMPSNQDFGQHLVANHLDVRDKIWRSNAMWLAEHEDELVTLLTRCTHSDPSQIRQWVRKQDPNRQPKKGTTKAGVSVAAQDVRDYVRPLIESDAPISVRQLVKDTGHSRIVVEAAIAAERGRKEGIHEAPVEILQLAEAMSLGQKAKDKLAALERRLRLQNEAEFDARVSASVRKHINEYVLPEYNRQLTEADDRLAKYKPPLTFDEYNTLIWALHEDQTDASRRADAFALVRRLRVMLRGPEKDERKPRTLPSTLAELMARRRKAA